MPASKSDPEMPTSGRRLDLDDLSVTVEAPTAEEALAQIAAQLGDDARIVSAEKVQRGGLAGFFAKEMVQITARPANRDGAATNGANGHGSTPGQSARRPPEPVPPRDS